MSNTTEVLVNYYDPTADAWTTHISLHVVVYRFGIKAPNNIIQYYEHHRILLFKSGPKTWPFIIIQINYWSIIYCSKQQFGLYAF